MSDISLTILEKMISEEPDPTKRKALEDGLNALRHRPSAIVPLTPKEVKAVESDSGIWASIVDFFRGVTDTTSSTVSDLATKLERTFTEEAFWTKIKEIAGNVVDSVIYTALLLYCIAANPNVPGWAKAAAVAALGYLIMPFDLIPDFTPVVGYADDLAALSGILKMLIEYVNEENKSCAKVKFTNLFGRKVEQDVPFY
jgi:uncharacterized membrane protein YkvA (DUF1232 family)